ncbi:hypothetical protein CLOP_g21618 [Closterium sp. NIES-67]|nr:hypothetical protein CLOP_g21618 [Closterium sp. NIES-67]
MLKPELPPDSPPAASAPGTSTGATGATGVEVLPLTLAIASLVVVVTLVVFITLALHATAAERSLALATDASEPVETPGARDIHELLDYGGLKASKECTVCLCDFNEGELVRSLPPCAHRFHVSCIDHWLAARTTCPVCRIDLETQTPDATIQSVTATELTAGESPTL